MGTRELTEDRRPRTAGHRRRLRRESKPNARRITRFEQLETRRVLTILIGGDAEFLEMGPIPNFTLPVQLPSGRYVQKLIVAGAPDGSPADSPANRVDANDPSSPYAGVGSLTLQHSTGNYICTATPIHPQYVLSAAHCLDIDDNGVADITGVNFNLNYDGNYSHIHAGDQWWIHPDYTGFAQPSVNDDISIIRLVDPLPAEIPIYEINRDSTVTGLRTQLVGYGQSGDGVTSSYTVDASYTVKRAGENVTDTGELDDEGGGAVEVWEADFDGPNGNNFTGGPTLGNDIETTLGGGDSGGPSFIPDGSGGLKVFGNNTYSFRFNFFIPAPLFDSGLGGMAVAQYADWIDSIVPLGPSINVTPSSGLLTTEGGGSDTFTVSLSQQPTANVTVNVSSTDTSEGNVNKSSLTFTDTNYATPQFVTITGADDNEWDRDVSYVIELTVAAGSASEYSAIDPDDVSVTNRDNEIQIVDDNDDGSDPRFSATYGGPPNWSYSPTGGIPFPGYQEDISYAIDGGGSNVASWTFSDLEPGAIYDVSATWTAPHPTDNRASDSPFEIFDGTNPLPVFSTDVNQELAPLPDHVEDNGAFGSTNFQILASAVAITGNTLVVKLNDNADEYVIADAVRVERVAAGPGVTIDRNGGLYVAEGGVSDSYSVKLNTQPTADVTITFDGGSQLNVPSPLTFTTLNWNIPQNVTVTAVDDSDDEGNHTGTIAHTATSGDSAYDNISIANVHANIADNDLVVLFEDSFEVSEWNGLWVEDSQNDWLRSTQRSTDGNYSAEVDGRATNATLTLNNALDISGMSSVDVTWDWLIEAGFDSGEFLAMDTSTNGGTDWTERLRLSGNVDQENTWHAGSIQLIPGTSTDLKIRFRSSVSRSNEDANVDNVRIFGVPAGPANNPPVASSDGPYVVNEDNPLNVAAPGVLGNDSDADGDALTAVLDVGPSNGTLTLNTDGSFVFTPNANFNGSDSFTYKANDGTADSNIATVSITVNAVNDPPVANDDSYSTSVDTPVNVSAPGVLGNDTDVEGNTLTAAAVSDPSNGALTLNADGSFTYTPNASFVGSDTFTYQANDGSTDGNTATVTITVSAVNNPPVANDDGYSINEDVSLNVAAPGVLGNDSDADLDPLSAVLVSGTANGTLTLNTDGSFVYSPNANFNGSDSFTYKANDGTADSSIATVSVAVNAVNDPPVANDDSYSTSEDTALSVAVPGVLGNDTDIDGDTLTAAVVSGPSNGTLTLNADGSFTYTPTTGFTGTDTFTYTVSDGNGGSDTGTVSITVVPGNTMHIGDLDAASTNQGKTWTASVTIKVHAGDETSVTGVIVSGDWGGGASGSASCETESGMCTVEVSNIRKKDGVVSFTVTGATDPNETFTYDADDNHDPDGDSDGTTISVNKPLHAASASVEEGLIGSLLAPSMMRPVVNLAISQWEAAGVPSEQLDSLRNVTVEIEDLSGSLLGLAYSDWIVLDRDAAGYGWSTSINSGGFDLLSAVTHEFGHILGFEDDHNDFGIMAANLDLGTRLLTSYSQFVVSSGVILEPFSSMSLGHLGDDDEDASLVGSVGKLVSPYASSKQDVSARVWSETDDRSLNNTSDEDKELIDDELLKLLAHALL